MADYHDGRWYRQQPKPATFPTIVPPEFRSRKDGRAEGYIRQQIKLEANDSRALFGLRPMLDASTNRRLGPELSGVDGTIYRADSRGGSFDYEVRSFRDSELPQPGESAPSEGRRALMLRVPERMAERLKTIAETVLSEFPADRRTDPREKALALDRYLRETGGFGYTLKLDVVDSSLDPIEDFLVNRKEGHCEYFASALTLLLRSAGIPARMVNGFKGGDWNELAKVLSVRQKHAHSWVEAYLGEVPGRERMPNWLTLDPTPGNERDKSLAKVGGFRANFRQISDLIRYIWVFYVVGYNAERQDRLLYKPIRRLVEDARNGFRIMAQALRTAKERLLELLHFQSVESFISWRGFIVSFVGLFFLVLLFRAAVWLTSRLLRRFLGRGEETSALLAGAAHYRRLAQLFADYGLVRPAAETQDEFARRATVFLTARGSNAVAVSDVPRVVVEAFYRVRFGRHELPPHALDHLEARLDTLESSLKSTQG